MTETPAPASPRPLRAVRGLPPVAAGLLAIAGNVVALGIVVFALVGKAAAAALVFGPALLDLV